MENERTTRCRIQREFPETALVYASIGMVLGTFPGLAFAIAILVNGISPDFAIAGGGDGAESLVRILDGICGAVVIGGVIGIVIGLCGTWMVHTGRSLMSRVSFPPEDAR